MDSISRKDYFDFIFSVVITAFTALLVAGQIVILSFGFTVGISDWGTEGTLAIGVGLFGFVIAISLSLTLFGAWRYWSIDSDGVTNGGIFWKRKILFAEVDRFEIKDIVIGAKPFITTQENICFYKGKNMVTIPAFCISKEEMDWIGKQIKNHE